MCQTINDTTRCASKLTWVCRSTTCWWHASTAACIIHAKIFLACVCVCVLKRIADTCPIWINLKLHRIWGLVPAVPRLYSAQEKNNFCLQHSCLIRSSQKLGYCLQLGYKWRGETIRFPSTFIARPSSGIEPMVWRQPKLTVRITWICLLEGGSVSAFCRPSKNS